MTFSRRSCTHCKKSYSAAPAKWVPFYKDKKDGSKHVRDIFPTLCSNCAIEKLSDSNSNGIVGVLTETYANEYKSFCNNNKHWEDLRTNGLTIISDPNFKNGMHLFVEGALYPLLAQKGKSDELRHNISNTKMTRTISTGKETKESGDFHDERRWLHIYPSNRHQTDSSLSNQMSQIQTYLSKVLFTHEHFAVMAEKAKRAFETPRPVWHCRGTELRRATQILKIHDVNVLIKGPTLNQAQSLHVDGYGLKLVVIYVDKSTDDDSGGGYEFFYIQGSHRMLWEHERHASTSQLPMKKVTRKIVRPGDCIVFFESLVHGGGACSSFEPICGEAASEDTSRFNRMGLEGFHWFGAGTSASTMLPVDISFQMTFDYKGCPSAYSVPNRGNTWYIKTDKLFEYECCPVCDELLSQSSESIVWGECKHAIHRQCLFEGQIKDKEVFCPACKPKRKWTEDSSAYDYMAEIDRLKEECNVETMLDLGCNQFIEHLHTGKRIKMIRGAISRSAKRMSVST